MTEPMLMMLAPSPRCLTAACVTSKRPSTLTLNCRWKCSSVIASMGKNSYTPELFTRMSSLP